MERNKLCEKFACGCDAHELQVTASTKAGHGQHDLLLVFNTRQHTAVGGATFEMTKNKLQGRTKLPKLNFAGWLAEFAVSSTLHDGSKN